MYSKLLFTIFLLYTFLYKIQSNENEVKPLKRDHSKIIKCLQQNAKDAKTDPDLRRYINALHHDESVGLTLIGLKLWVTRRALFDKCVKF